jgi:hypothetical protein
MRGRKLVMPIWIVVLIDESIEKNYCSVDSDVFCTKCIIQGFQNAM